MTKVSEGPWNTSDETLLNEFWRCLDALKTVEDHIEKLEKRIDKMLTQHHQFIHDYGLFDD